MDNKSWSIVKFIGNEISVEAVPTNWLISNRTCCLWPTYTKERLRKAIRNCEPALSCWEEHQVIIFRNGTYSDYAIARKKCQKAEETSDLDSGREMKVTSRGRQSKPSTKFLSSSSESASDEEEDISQENAMSALPPVPLVTLSKVKPVNSQTLTNSCDSDIAKLDSFKQANQEQVDGTLVCTCCPAHKNNNFIELMIRQVMRKLTLMEVALGDIRVELNRTAEIAVTTNLVSNIWEQFDMPFRTKEDLLVFDEYLKDSDENMKKSILELSKVGGDSAYDCVRRALFKLLTNRLASEYSWMGLKQKKIFSKLAVVNLLICSVQKNPKTLNVSQKDIEDAIKKYLRRSKERADAEDKKK